MKKVLLVVLCLPLYSCDSTHKTTPIRTSKADTNFISRSIDSTGYYAIYIETNRESIYYTQLANFKFDDYDSADIISSYQCLVNEHHLKPAKVDLLDLPREWLPLYAYKKKYYIYKPCEWGLVNRQIINDSLLISWTVGGLSTEILSSIKKISTNSYTVGTKTFYDGKIVETEIHIHVIDTAKTIALWEYLYKDGTNPRYQLFIPKDSAKNYELIVNYCSNKVDELVFDSVNYAEPTKNADNP